MNQDEFKAQLQAAQDMLTAVSNQRNAAQNECVQMAAQIMALQRKVEALTPKDAQEPELPLDKPVGRGNGHVVGEAGTAAH